MWFSSKTSLTAEVICPVKMSIIHISTNSCNHFVIFLCKGVWSKLNQGWHSFFSTFEMISYRKRYSISFRADSDKSTLVEVFQQRENPILWNKLCAQYQESRSMSPTTFGYFLISALVAALAMDQVITGPRLLIPFMYFWTTESNWYFLIFFHDIVVKSIKIY